MVCYWKRMKTKDAIIIAENFINILSAKGEIDRDDVEYKAIKHLIDKADFFDGAVEVYIDDFEINLKSN